MEKKYRGLTGDEAYILANGKKTTNGGDAGSVENNYATAKNKPSINGVTLLGNKTSKELGLVTEADIPTKLPNPEPLTIQKEGEPDVVYDGSSAKVVKLSVDVDVPEKLPNPKPLTVKEKGKPDVVYDGSDAKTIQMPDELKNPEALTIKEEGKADITYDGSTPKVVTIPTIPDIPDIPDKLPNPKTLTIRKDGEPDITYDGSVDKTVVIPTPAAVDIPDSLKNPEALTIKQTGKPDTVYDGSRAETITIPDPTTVPAELPNPETFTVHEEGKADVVYDGSSPKEITIPTIPPAPTIPDKLPNPQKLIITQTEKDDIEYDGSSEQRIHIPSAAVVTVKDTLVGETELESIGQIVETSEPITDYEWLVCNFEVVDINDLNHKWLADASWWKVSDIGIGVSNDKSRLEISYSYHWNSDAAIMQMEIVFTDSTHFKVVSKVATVNGVYEDFYIKINALYGYVFVEPPMNAFPLVLHVGDDTYSYTGHKQVEVTIPNVDPDDIWDPKELTITYGDDTPIVYDGKEAKALVIPKLPEVLPNPTALTIKKEGQPDIVYDGTSPKTVVLSVDVPDSLKNPKALTIHEEGKTDVVYDGSDEKSVTIPDKLPNPEAVTFGGVLKTQTYDGKTAVTVEFPDARLTDEITGSPVGEIISFMGTEAPLHYLKCDGATYLIEDVPELADHFEKAFGAKNFFGGDGITTIAMPDLRGEFLRSTGTAARNTGSGSNVGMHQNGTQIQNFFTPNSTDFSMFTGMNDQTEGVRSADTRIEISNRRKRISGTGYYENIYAVGAFTSRPTNTSVLFCIKFETTYFGKFGAGGIEKVETLTIKQGTEKTEFDGTEPKTVNIPTIPEAIKSPSALTIKEKGKEDTVYDGSDPKVVTLPSELPNPNKLKINGLFGDAEYDGSEEVSFSYPDAEITKKTMGSPVGEIISYMGNTVPENYLDCDGSVYDIADYRELADHFEAEFGSVNFFGGDGLTTFAVPDLRGEFLRGTGTNGHANQGDGADVGQHQNSTGFPLMRVDQNNDLLVNGIGYNADVFSKDSNYNLPGVTGNRRIKLNTENNKYQSDYFSARPTNTSVKYCIKYITTYGMALSEYLTKEDVEKRDEKIHEKLDDLISNANDTPTGTIISFMGTHAPEDYLVCDGSTYNIKEYHELAEFIIEHFGTVNHFGGDGTTTFAVPDLRGEFLRGTGANSHTWSAAGVTANEGSGAEVGQHQGASKYMIAGTDSSNSSTYPKYGSFNSVSVNADAAITNPVSGKFKNSSNDGEWNDGRNDWFTSRPTNTSVLYCIKYRTSFRELTAEHGQFGLTSNYTTVKGQDVPLVLVRGNMSMQDNNIKLKKGRTYQFIVSLSYTLNMNTGNVHYRFIDITNGVLLAQFQPYRSPDSNYEFSSSCNFQYTPETDCLVKMNVNTVFIQDNIDADLFKLSVFEIGRAILVDGSSSIELEVDSEMSDESENAVQNKVVKEYVDGEVEAVDTKAEAAQIAADTAQTTANNADTKATKNASDILLMNNRLDSMIGNSDDSPVGTIISFMGKTAPRHYLICDGSTYNIAEYPELATFVTTQFGSVNYFGGNGTTTFAVPDLRGEFIRGSGTASRNTGSGAAVGVHQDGTTHVDIKVDNSYNNLLGTNFSSKINEAQNVDALINNSSDSKGRLYVTGSVDTKVKGYQQFTSRPTNTSVLFCIKFETAFKQINYITQTDKLDIFTIGDMCHLIIKGLTNFNEDILDDLLIGYEPLYTLRSICVFDINNLGYQGMFFLTALRKCGIRYMYNNQYMNADYTATNIWASCSWQFKR